MTKEQGSKAHLYLYDWVRVIGTVLVVLGHSVYMNWSGDMGGIALDYTNAVSNFAWWQTVLGKAARFAYMFHMPLFFTLSGAVYAIGSKTESLGALAKKKLKRLIVPYYVGGFLWMFPLRYMSGFYADADSLIKALNCFATGRYAMGHLWFLPSLFMCFMLFYIIHRPSDTGGGYIQTLIICFLLSFQFSGLCTVSGFGFPSCLSYIIYFAVGYGIELYRKNVKQSLPLETGVFLVTSVMLYNELQGRAFIADEFMLALVGIFWTLSLCMLICRIGIMNNRVIRRLSADSFLVYILHDPINFIMLGFGEKLIGSRAGIILFFGMRSWLNIVVCLLLAELIHYTIKVYRKKRVFYDKQA